MIIERIQKMLRKHFVEHDKIRVSLFKKIIFFHHYMILFLHAETYLFLSQKHLKCN